MFIKDNNMTEACTWVSLHELRQASTQVVLSLVTSHFHKKNLLLCRGRNILSPTRSGDEP